MIKLKPGDRFGVSGHAFVREVKHVWPAEAHNLCDIVEDTTGAQWGASLCFPYREAKRQLGDEGAAWHSTPTVEVSAVDDGDALPEWTKDFEPDPAPALSEVQEAIIQECDNISNMLLAKNRQYGDSAMNPLRIFSRADAAEQLRVRIDDKLSRILRGIGDEEDTVGDLIGYLVLYRCRRRLGGV